MAALIALMGTTWFLLATFLAYHFRKPLTGDIVRFQESRPQSWKVATVDKESIELDILPVLSAEQLA